MTRLLAWWRAWRARRSYRPSPADERWLRQVLREQVARWERGETP